ncbi:enolase C-terminal domain-like protein [Reyranella sp.]|uniref:enolase C-terminal domain-like protein n=1 Tax=Reyranella sp. TaxID=1929291 RepID=UPI003BAC9267
MIIERIDPIALRLPKSTGDGALHLVLCRVTTRSGLVGYGECLCLRPASQRSLVAAIADAIAPLHVGRSVEERESLNREARIRMASFGRAGTNLNALAAVDIALWDIAGKAAGRSLSDLLGGARRGRVPVMASLDRYNDATRVAPRIAKALGAGVAAVKVHEFDLAVIEAARRQVGPGLPFVADCNSVHSLADIGRDIARWRALDLLWLEDPVWPPEAMLGAPELPGIVVGQGADLGSAEQLAVYARPPIGVLQPDVCMIGGVSETRRAIAMLEPLGVSIAPHTPFIGPAALATLHLLAAMKQEAWFAVIEAEPSMALYADEAFTRWQPSLAVPTGPGLGADPDPAWLERHSL